ncbi:hypothetical protein ABES02_20625 [Neobacillus pocheonensis]|uniref:hypothetical protein n=1 Tax=Neobacillus pocheonensis TaxID=363869 RepID=UPI003D2E4680
MSTTKKVEQEAALDSNRFVDTLWNQYEQSLNRSRKMRERREEAYLNAVKEVVKFNQEFRGSLASLFQTSRQTSSELVKGVSSSLVKRVEETQAVRPELKDQFGEVTERIEQLTMAPLAAGLDLLQRFEENFVEGSENYVNYTRERRNGWEKVSDEYVKAARNSHKKLARRLEESGKVLVSTN